MMLSAFLIYRPYARSRLDGRPPPSLKRYARNRFLRVVPPYWVALTITALWITTAGVGVFTASGIPTYYLFGQVYSPETVLGGIAIAWFLCILVAFYVFVPLYAAVMRRFGTDRAGRFNAELWGCAALLAFGVVYRIVVDLAGLRDEYVVSYLLPAYFDWLAPGMALAVLSVWFGKRWTGAQPEAGETPLPGAFRAFARVPSLGLAIALVGFWFVSTQIGLTGPYPDPGDHLQYFAEHTLNLLIALFVFLPFAIGDPRQGLTRRLLNNRALLFLCADLLRRAALPHRGDRAAQGLGLRPRLGRRLLRRVAGRHAGPGCGARDAQLRPDRASARAPGAGRATAPGAPAVVAAAE